MANVSLLAPKKFPRIPAIAGVRLSTTAAGIRYKDREDLLFIETMPGTTVAGMLTKSQTASASVKWCKKALKNNNARGLIVNSGNANVFTGKTGENAVSKTIDKAVLLLKCPKNQIFVCL